jgi:hypothetical protein
MELSQFCPNFVQILSQEPFLMAERLELSMLNKKTVKTLRLDQPTDEKVTAYCAATGLKEATALRQLIERGLMTEGLSLYATPLGQFVRDVMQGQLDLFRDELEQRNDDLEERIAKITAKGAKYSIYGALLQTDLARGIIPAWKEMSAEAVWKAYSKQAGELQRGKAFKDIRAGVDDES